ncbi:MFS transporter [Leptospira wolffii]|uniref:MFS transporter n=1 Tax=Leptospira wolffii TaxID=409998 RepID=UPI0002F3D4D5|nr:MFS transporter [Leptospira wolffii]EPG66676.1 transporter, major facilitator family protein [Leptospira wolffii serovar Khorat str. Khorat-H2]
MILFYYISSILGLLAGNMFNYTAIILAQSISPSDTFSGWVFFCVCAPLLFLSFTAGRFLDKYSRKWVLAGAQLSMAFGSGFAALGLEFGWIGPESPYPLLVSSVLSGIGLTFVMPGRFAILGDLVDHSKIGKHSVWLNTLVLFGYGLAPLVAGFLRHSFPFPVVFLGIGSAYLTSVFLLLLLPISSGDRKTSSRIGLKETWEYLERSELVKQFLLMMGTVVLLVGPVQVLLPKYAKEILGLGEAERGAILTSLGIGLVLGGMLTSFLHSFRRKGHILFGAALVSSLLFSLLPFLSDSLPFTAALLFVFGFLTGVIITLIPVGIQQHTENHIRGRILSMYSLVFLIVPAVTGILSGFFSDRIGIPSTFVWAGFLEMGALIYMSWRMDQIRERY